MTETPTRLLLRLMSLHQKLSKTADEDDARAALSGRDGKRTVWVRLSELDAEIQWVREKSAAVSVHIDTRGADAESEARIREYARQIGPNSTL